MSAPAAMNSIDIDVGGTFTDLVLYLDGDTHIAKCPTTPHDLSVGFQDAIESVADNIGTTMDALLPKIDVVRYSTTVALNRLIERRGPRVGLVTTEGFEDTMIIGRGAQWLDGRRYSEIRNVPAQRKPAPLITRDLTVGVRERIDSTGRILRPLDEEDVRAKLRTLMDKGARAIVIALLWSFHNPVHERRVREIIREEYKEYQLGFVPVVLSSVVVPKIGEYERTMTAVLDAYLQRDMQAEISATWDKIRERGYRGSFLMIHNSGGCGEIFKTSASRTFNGGPIAGLIGSAHFAKQLGYKNVIAGDVGGTSFDVALVVESGVRNYDFKPVIDTWMVNMTMMQTLSIGAGGGSIAAVDPVTKRLTVGPRSAGSMPGPVCYNQGGSEPTVTDADLVLGYINPGGYFGGKMQLSGRKAERAIRDKIAKPLGIDTLEAAAQIRRIIDESMASAIKREVHMRGFRPDDFVLFAFGGAGPTHVAGFKADVPSAVVFPTAPVFCALGSSLMDFVHMYEQSRRMMFMEPKTERFVADHAQFNETVEALMDKARGELMAEGLPVADAIFSLELDMLYGGQVQVKRFASPRLRLESEDDARLVYEAFETEISDAYSPLVVNRPGGAFLDNFVLRVTVPTHKPELPTFELEGEDPSAAATGSREAWWPETAESRESALYSFEKLRPGNRITGPAIVEAEFTTIVIPPGEQFAINEHGLGVMQADDPGTPHTTVVGAVVYE